MTTVSVLGLGNMGAALARALLRAGHDVSVWNRSPARAEPFRLEGATVKPTAHAASIASEVVIVCLLDYPAIEDALAATIDGHSLSGRAVVQLTLGRPEETEALADRIHEAGGRYLGGFIKAYPREIGTEAAELHYSGSKEVFDRYRTVLEALGEPVFVSTDVVVGNVLNNSGVVFLESILGSFFENAAAAVKGGVPVELVARTLNRALRIATVTVDHSWTDMVQNSTAVMSATEAALSVHANALTSAKGSMDDRGLSSRFGTLALEILREAITDGHGEKEISHLYQYHLGR